MSAKRDMFELVLKSSFDINSFVNFTRELLIDERLIAPNKQNKVFSNFTGYIVNYTHIANYTGRDGKAVAVFAVELKSGEYVERARSIQRNFVKKLIENGSCDGALVAFYTSDSRKWRLSFIRIDYDFANGKVDTKLTPVKRYSYLVGEDEPCHTAMTRLFPIFVDETTNPSLDEIEDAFSVEKVTKEFFDQYKEKYHEVREWLEKSDNFMSEAERCDFTSEQFAKKLMGQIAFLYFVQKKGWLGVQAFPKTLSEKEYNKALFAKGNISKKIIPVVYKKIQDTTYKLYVPGLNTLKDDEERLVARCLRGYHGVLEKKIYACIIYRMRK